MSSSCSTSSSEEEDVVDWNEDMDGYCRECWEIGDKVEVYSNSRRDWFESEIVDVFEDEDGE